MPRKSALTVLLRHSSAVQSPARVGGQAGVAFRAPVVTQRPIGLLPRNGPKACSSMCGPRTTYEGNTLEIDVFQQLQYYQVGFSRSTFVRERSCPEELKGKYSIDKLLPLGVGATARVYRAVNRRTGQEVAVKEIDKEDVSSPAMLESEIQIHKATDHPNILRLLETFEDAEKLYLVVELCEGGDLRQQLMANMDEFSACQMPEEDALQLFRQMVSSVLYIHSRGIAHRDLKPANFLCLQPGPGQPKKRANRIIKLADFGVSAFCHGERHRCVRKVGTDGFMAPEVMTNVPYDGKQADIFSLGCLLHLLLAGSPPKFRDNGSYEVRKLRLRHASREVRELIERLMNPQPDLRPSAEELTQLPLLQNFRQRRRATSKRLETQVLDQMYNYSAFPLLKKAAVMAMVSRAESDDAFVRCIESFRSLTNHVGSCGVSADNIYEALREELCGDMEHAVRRTLGSEFVPTKARRKAPVRRPALRRISAPTELCGFATLSDASVAATERFKEDLRSNVENLIRKIDATGTGQISYSEWLAATVDSAWYMDAQRISAAFKLFDYDGDGLISEDDLKKIIPDVFNKLPVDSVLQESQLSAKQTSWITEENFFLLIRSQNPSSFTLRRIANGVEDPLAASEAAIILAARPL